MIISDNIRIGESVRFKSDRILDALRVGETCSNIIWYAITTSYEDDTLMYIMNGMEFRHSFYHQGNLRLLGLAGSRKEACEMVLNLVQEGYNTDNIQQMKQYLETI